MKTKLLVGTAAMAVSFTAAAAEAMTHGMDMRQAMPSDSADHSARASALKPHNHYEANKQGIASSAAARPVKSPKKPLHDHLKAHKQQ